jgi:hypothetical protein
MRVTLGTLAYSGIEARFGPSTAAGVDAALRHYTRRLASRRPPAPVPSFARRPPATPVMELDLAVGSQIEAALSKESERQGVSIDLILAHAVFVYLADLDTAEGGRVAEEGASPSRYPRRCAFVDTGSGASGRRQVGSA